jgi:crossover junction endodeoxyribonuclease RuvC
VNPAPSEWVIGIDPGTRVIGWGVLQVSAGRASLQGCGVFRAQARATIATRLGVLMTQLDELLAGHAPGTLAVETAFAARNVKSALRIGEARGMVMAAAARRGFEVVEIPPATAKKAVVGHGAGSKQQVALMVASILGVPPLDVPADATDALAVALAHVNQSRLAGLLPGVARPRPMRRA